MVLNREFAGIERLEAFDAEEVRIQSEVTRIHQDRILREALEECGALLKVLKLQLEHEELSHLEYSTHRLQSLTLNIGCFRLAFVAEQMCRNLKPSRLDYLRELFLSAYEEFEYAQRIIGQFLLKAG